MGTLFIRNKLDRCLHCHIYTRNGCTAKT